jgi:hypothetical protein
MSAIDDLDDPPRGWEAVPERIRYKLESAWDSDVPALASAVHARWWQLETWLRSLVYVELRAAYGNEWLEIVGKTAIKRSESLVNLGFEGSGCPLWRPARRGVVTCERPSRK